MSSDLAFTDWSAADVLGWLVDCEHAYHIISRLVPSSLFD
jgi:hypothetical protein